MAKFTLIIRPQPDADRDVGWLNRYGVPALASPVMIGAPVSSPSLAHDLGRPADFTGIIFTSRHAVDAVAKATDAAAWISKLAFVVGSATAAAAKQAGFKNIIIGSGGGEGLVEPIRQALADINRAKSKKPIYYGQVRLRLVLIWQRPCVTMISLFSICQPII